MKHHFSPYGVVFALVLTFVWAIGTTQKHSLTNTSNMNIGQAVQALKQGQKVAREGWNGKGMYLYLDQSHPVNAHLNSDYHNAQVDGTPKHLGGQMLDTVVMRTAGPSDYHGEGYADYVPWLCSQTDLLATDWQIVETK